MAEAMRDLPRWLVAALVGLHALPLILVSAALLPESALKTHWSVTSSMLLVTALCITIAWVIHATLLAPLQAAPRLRFQPLPSPDIEREFGLWKNRSFSQLSSLLILGWAAWWNLLNPIISARQELGTSTFGPPYLVPNLLACAFLVRAMVRFRHGTEIMELLELAMAWAAALAIPVINTTVFLTGADPVVRANQIDVEMQGGHEVWLTWPLVGVVLAMQPFRLRIQLRLLCCNAVASGVGCVLCAWYSRNWSAFAVRLHVLLSMWVGWMGMQFTMLQAIKPAWIRRQLSKGDEPHREERTEEGVGGCYQQ